MEGEPIMMLYLVAVHAHWVQTESADEWSYQKGLEGGWIPQNPSQRLYPGLCS